MKINNILTINDTLQPIFWSNNILNSQISDKLIEIAKKFFDDLDLEGVDIEDITFTGSLANYNWTKYSDVDLHLLVDFSKIDENYDLVREFFNAKTSLWNKTHNILLKTYEVEIYVQDINEDHHSTGVYSILNNEWIAEPVKVEPKVDTDMVKRKINSFIDMIERVEDSCDNKEYEKCYNMAVNLARKIKKFRKSGLEDKGEYSNENLTFKYLRNHGFIETLYNMRNESYDKMMSLEGEYQKKFKIFISQDIKEEKKGFHRLEELEKFQKKVKKHHKRRKKTLIGLGKQKTGPAYPKKPSYRRGKSSPAGFGGV